MKLITRLIPLLVLMLLLSFAVQTKAQGFSAYIGAGTASAPSNNQLIDTFGDGNLYSTPSLGGLFGVFGGDLMWKHAIGFGAEYSWRIRQGDYAGLNYRPSFYDFNVILHPLPVSTRIVPEFQAGLGGAHINFYYSSQFCDIFAGCSTSNTFLESSNHFQLHLAGAVKLYVTHGIFIKPQIDAHWVNNFTQFGRGWVPEYTVSVGYTLGGR